MEKKMLVKASGAVHIANKLSLRQKIVWNFLLMRAYDELIVKDKYQIAFYELYDLLGTRNDKDIKKTINSLSRSVYFNILGKDNLNEWGTYTLLSFIDIANGILTYSFDKKLRQLLYKPQYYAIVNLAIQQKFSCKYSLFLYELCLDYIGLGHTPWIDIDTFRDFMGIETNEYIEFKFLSKNVIQKAANEINDKSDLVISVIIQRLGRKVVKIRYSIAKKVISTPTLIPNKTPINYLPAQMELNDEQKRVLSVMIASDIKEEAAIKAIHKYDLNVIRNSIKLLNASIKDIQNKTGWFLDACKGKWSNHELEKQKQRVSRDRKESLQRELREKIRVEYAIFTDEEPIRRYYALSLNEQRDLDIQYELWKKVQKKNNLQSDEHSKKQFLYDRCLEDYEKDWQQWARAKGYNIA